MNRHLTKLTQYLLGECLKNTKYCDWILLFLNTLIKCWLWYNMKAISFAKWNWELPQFDYHSALSGLVKINLFLEMSILRKLQGGKNLKIGGNPWASCFRPIHHCKVGIQQLIIFLYPIIQGRALLLSIFAKNKW